MELQHSPKDARHHALKALLLKVAQLLIHIVGRMTLAMFRLKLIQIKRYLLYLFVYI